MKNTPISLAIISDIHCHGQLLPNKKQESFQYVGLAKSPKGINPMQSLKELAIEEHYEADVIICCGDLSHQICEEGLQHSWDWLRNDLKQAFGAKVVYCTLGNHDVHSRKGKGSPFRFAKTMDPEFPFMKKEDNDCYWANGYCLQSIEGLDILVINTAFDHYSLQAANRGSFAVENIDSLQEYLKDKLKSDLRIAFFHHHPILHDSLFDDSSDVLNTGTKLLNTLSDHGFNLIIHGHRHRPYITLREGPNPQYVMCAGSFSKFLEKVSSLTRNVFHMVRISAEESEMRISGKIKTWQYNYGNGWNPATLTSAGFPHELKIGIRPDYDLSERIAEYFNKHKLAYLEGTDLFEVFPSIEYLFPNDFNVLRKSLEDEHRITMKFSNFEMLSGLWRMCDA